jgi:hypothetical protein
MKDITDQCFELGAEQPLWQALTRTPEAIHFSRYVLQKFRSEDERDFHALGKAKWLATDVRKPEKRVRFSQTAF